MRNYIFKNSMLSLVTSLALGMSGCGGDATDSEKATTLENIDTKNVDTEKITNETVTKMRGVIALGNGAASFITLIGSQSNTLIGTSDDNGSYSIDASSLTQPIMVKAIIEETGDIMYSFAETNSGIVNVTPLTTFVVNQAATASGITGGASQLFENFKEGIASSQIIDNIDTETEHLNAVVGTVMVENNVSNFDHFNEEFEADHNGYDAVLDELDIEVYQDNVIIREGNQTIDTLNYSIIEENIDIIGSITDITNNLPLENVSIVLTDNAEHKTTTSSDENGSFLINVETMRVYDVTISVEGYQTQLIPDVASFIFTESNIGNISMIPVGEESIASISGSIIDGRTLSKSIPNTNLNFRVGYGNRVGEISKTVTTNAQGKYTLDSLPAGIYTVEISHEDYYSIFKEIVIYGNENIENFSLLAKSSQNSNFFATISLNWDNNPSDLDSHLTGPMVDSKERFHLSYENQLIDENYMNQYNYTEDNSYLNLYKDAMKNVTGIDYSNLSEDTLWDDYSALSYEDMILVDDFVYESENEQWLSQYKDAMQSVTGIDYSNLSEEELEEAYKNLSDSDMNAVDTRLYPDDIYEEEVNNEEDIYWLNIYRDAMSTVTHHDYSETDEDLLWEEYDNLSEEDMLAVDTIIMNANNTYYNDYEAIIPCSNGEIASLDRDRTDDYLGFYPETVTLCNVQENGLYKYYVNNYSGETSMSEGDAQVTVSTINGVSQTFNAPVSTIDNTTGNVWHVFNIDAAGNIYPVNKIIGNDDESSYSSIYTAPTRLKTDIRFSADKDLLKGLSIK